MNGKSGTLFKAIALVAIMAGALCLNSTTFAEGERNLAYRRAMYQSSSYNCNETAQLAADGIINDDSDEINMAYTFKHEHGNESRYGNVQYLFDRDTSTNWETYHKNAWVSVKLPRRTVVKSYSLASGQANWSNSLYAEGWILEGSNDGVNYSVIDTKSNQTFAYNGEQKTFAVPSNQTGYTCYRLNMTAKTDRIYMSEWNLYDENGEAILTGYDQNLFEFTSVWMSETNANEWIYADLGDTSTVNSVKIHWGSAYAKEYEIQISDNATDWQTIAEKTDGAGGTEDIQFNTPESGRYVKLLCKTLSNQEDIGFIVKEFEVLGTNNVHYTVEAEQSPIIKEDGTTILSGGNWKVERASLVDAQADKDAQPENETDLADETGALISTPEYDSSSWLPAVVPGTVLTSYKRANAVPDPNYADQQKFISDSYFKSNFWYQNRFTVPPEKQGEKVWLNFQAINWKAEVYLNGNRLGNIRGAFTRAKFDATEFINYGGENYLAVLIYKNTDPGTAYISNDSNPGTMGGVFGNGGSIGRDAPTYSAAAGWDWVPTVRGRNIGIYNEVSISYTKDVQLTDPWVITKFERTDNTPTNPIDAAWVGPDELFNVNRDSLNLSKANLTLKTEVKNTSDLEITAKIKGIVAERPDIVFEKNVVIPPNSAEEITFDTLAMENPEIWWPNTYGEQPLYTMNVTVETNGRLSDSKEFQFGIREVTYHLEQTDYKDRNGYNNGDKLAIYCNGVRIIVRGGNWGLEDADLNVNAEKYDEKIRLQKEANFNMIRNWGGQTNDPEFYRACDKYGVLIWDDFFLPGCWLHHPQDMEMFLQNAVDKVKNYRSHACLVLYCGANEMWPERDDYTNDYSPNTLESGLRRIVEDYDSTRTYIPNSAEKPVAVDGPHQAKSPQFYFTNSLKGLMNSERGLPNIPVKETLKKIFPEENLWPQNEMWALHDFAMQWNVNGAAYMEALKNYGDFDSFDGFVSRAQMQGYEIHKAMFESVYAVDTNGLLMWMSNPAWTSLMWQSYDYYHDGNGGYYGSKHANQPINYIWNASDNTMVLHNSTPNEEVLTASVDIYDINGNLLYNDTKTRTLASDTKEQLMTLVFPKGASPLKFIKTTVKNADGKTVGCDFYWHNTMAYGEYPNYQDYSSMADMEPAQITAQYIHTGDDDTAEYPYKHYKILLKNTSDMPAVMVRLKVLKESDGERVLPVYYEDNYFSLMPGEVKEVWAEFKQSSLGNDSPIFKLEGWNVEECDFQEGNDAYISNVSLSKTDGESEKVLSSGNYKGSVDVITASEQEIDFNIILALYRDNIVEKVTMTPISMQVPAGKTTLESDILELSEEDYENCEIRGFVWMDNMIPVNNGIVMTERDMLPQTYANRNLALEAESIQASTQDYRYPAQYAIDGDTNTRWVSEYQNDNWLLVDLGEEKEITSFSIQWESAYAKKYRIEISSDGQNFTELVREDNGDGGTDQFGFEATRARYVRWVGEERATDWGYSMYEFEINNNTEPNLALHADVTVSSNEYSTTDPQKLVDGDLSSRWTSEWDTPGMSESEKDNQWIVLDLKQEKTFRSIYLVWESAFGKKYTIEVSNDNENYTQLFSETNGTAGTNRYRLEQEVNARYIKFNLKQRGTGWGYSVFEIMLYE